jgi:phenolic acid decarboxylase
MHITYHKQIPKDDEVVNTIPHEILCDEVKEFIREQQKIRGKIEQKRYYFFDNGWFWFLYLDNGDRIDIAF